MTTPLTSNHPSSNPSGKKGKSCLLISIGCGVLSLIGFLIVIILLALTETEKDKNAATTPQIPKTESTASSPPSLTKDEALKIGYPAGTYAATAPKGSSDLNVDMEGGARWDKGTLYRQFPPLDGESDVASPDLAEYITTVNNLVSFRQSGKEKLLVILDSRPVGTPTFTPSLGAAVLAWNGNSWILESRNELSEIGTDGEDIPAGQLIQVGPDLYGYRIDYGWMHQGIYGGITRFIAQNSDHVFVEFNDIVTSGGNDGAGLSANETYTFDSKMEFLKNASGQNYFPLRITWSGTCPNANDGISKINASATYQKCAECDGYETDESDIYKICDVQ